MPEWLVQHGVEPGDYLTMSKSQLRSQMRPDRPLKVQVWACGMLHTASYKGEIALTMHGGKQVLLTPAVIIKELHAAARRYYEAAGIQLTVDNLKSLRETKEHMRRIFEELEADGLCDRRSDGRSIREMSNAETRRLSGKIEYHFFLKPKDAHPEVGQREWARQVLAKSQHHQTSGSNSAIWLPHPPIGKILNAFGFRFSRIPKVTLQNPNFQAAIDRWLDSARQTFIEVATPWLPIEVVSRKLPEVAAPGGAFVTNVERKEGTPSSCVGVQCIGDPLPRASKQAGPLAEDPENQELRHKIRTYLIGKFAVPTPLYPDLIAQIAAVVQDEAGLQQLQEATKNTQPRTWKVFLHIARECAAARPDYQKFQQRDQDSEEVKIPGWRPMPRSQAVAKLQEAVRLLRASTADDDVEDCQWAREQLQRLGVQEEAANAAHA